MKRTRKFWFRGLAVLLLLTCLSLLSGGMLLKRGIRIDSFAIGQTEVTDFFLQWQDRLVLEVNAVTINSSGQGKVPVDLSSVGRGVRLVHTLATIFSRITVKDINVGALTGSFSFDPASGRDAGFIRISSADFNLQADLAVEQDILLIHLTEMVSQRFKSTATGSLRINTSQTSMSGQLSVDLARTLPLDLDFQLDQKQLSFKGRGSREVASIKPIVDLFVLKPGTQRWITEYLKGSSYNLESISGVLPWKKPAAIVNTLQAKVKVADCQYTFAEGLQPIKSSFTSVVFRDGILDIVPHGATFYGQDTGKSGVAIDFNDAANIILTVRLNTLARLNRDIIALLGYYKIAMPFRQTAGKVDTQLTLAINLNRKEVTTQGRFKVGQGEFVYGTADKRYQLQDSSISLQNSEVTIEQAQVSLAGMFDAAVSGILNLRQGTGDITVLPEQLNFKIGKSILKLDSKAKKPVLNYHFSPKGTLLTATASAWMLDSLSLHLASFKTTLSGKNFSGTLSSTLLTILPSSSARLSGVFSIPEKTFNFQAVLFQDQWKDLILKKPGVQLDIIYDGKLTLRSKTVSHWQMNKVDVTVYPSESHYNNSVFTISNARMIYGSFFDSILSGSYNVKSGKGSFLLKELYLMDKEIGELLGRHDGVTVQVTGKDRGLILEVPALDLKISTDEKKGWTASFSDLATIHEYSRLLRKYRIDAGSLTVFSKTGKKPYGFSAVFPWQYPILIRDGKALDRLTVEGSIDDRGVTARINKDLQIISRDQLRITSTDLSYSLPAIIDFIKAQSGAADSIDKQPVNFSWDAVNSGLYLTPDSRLLADRLHLTAGDGKTNLLLEHGDGRINCELAGKQFVLNGKGLNDRFMSGLLAGAEAVNGEMSITAQGTFDQFSVLIKIRDTVLEKFTFWNNILTFMNTIPALVTFSSPTYDSSGLPVTEAVIGMIVREGKATVESFTVDSPVVKMLGTGWIDFPRKLIDMDFELTTQARTNLQKIPLAGYILTGDEEASSLTVRLSGNLDDPEVDHSAVKEVVTMPFGMLLRTLTLPFHLVESMRDGSNRDENIKRGEKEKSVGKRKSPVNRSSDPDDFYGE